MKDHARLYVSTAEFPSEGKLRWALGQRTGYSDSWFKKRALAQPWRRIVKDHAESPLPRSGKLCAHQVT
jgi:hypothetical protein